MVYKNDRSHAHPVPTANIPSTTALATINKAHGRRQGLQVGAMWSCQISHRCIIARSTRFIPQGMHRRERERLQSMPARPDSLDQSFSRTQQRWKRRIRSRGERPCKVSLAASSLQNQIQEQAMRMTTTPPSRCLSWQFLLARGNAQNLAVIEAYLLNHSIQNSIRVTDVFVRMSASADPTDYAWRTFARDESIHTARNPAYIRRGKLSHDAAQRHLHRAPRMPGLSQVHPRVPVKAIACRWLRARGS